MKRAVIGAVLAFVLAAGVAVAQQPPASPTPHQEHRGAQGMCSMMGGGGMMMGGQADPRSMQMRGEMMKAMGDIMMKYGKMMEGAGR